VCADPNYKLNVHCLQETPWANLFLLQYVLETEQELENSPQDGHCCVPSFPVAGLAADGTRQKRICHSAISVAWYFLILFL
jgi:hypothetical protein